MATEPKRLIVSAAEARALHDGGIVEVWCKLKLQPYSQDVDKLRIVGPDKVVHYTRPADHPMIAEARNAPGYRVMTLQECLLEFDCPFPPGSRWWVAEAWEWTAETLEASRAITEDITSGSAVNYQSGFIDHMRRNGMSKADAELCNEFQKWLPAITMPRWASRTIAESLACRVELREGVWHWVSTMRGEKA